MTNAERIKGMDTETLARFMYAMTDCVSCHNHLQVDEKCDGDARKCLSVVTKWLNRQTIYDDYWPKFVPWNVKDTTK